MNKLSMYFKAVSAIAVVLVIVFMAGNSVVAGIESDNNVSITENADAGHSSAMEKCGAGKCGGSEKSASKASAEKKEANAVTVDKGEGAICASCGTEGCTNCDKKESEVKEMDKKASCGSGKCGDGKCGGSEKSTDAKNADKKETKTAKEAKCGSGKCGG